MIILLWGRGIMGVGVRKISLNLLGEFVVK